MEWERKERRLKRHGTLAYLYCQGGCCSSLLSCFRRTERRREGRTGFSLGWVWPRNELVILSSHDGAVGVAEWNGIWLVLVLGYRRCGGDHGLVRLRVFHTTTSLKLSTAAMGTQGAPHWKVIAGPARRFEMPIWLAGAWRLGMRV